MTSFCSTGDDPRLLRIQGIPDIEDVVALRQREDAYILSSDESNDILSRRQHLTWRPKIFDWFYKMIDHYSYDRQLVAIAMDYLDRFILLYNDRREIDSMMYQLAAMGCLYIAVKIHRVGDDSRGRNTSGVYRSFRLDDYSRLSRGQFTEQDLTQMELVICRTLNWKLNPVTPTCFLVPLLGLFVQNPLEPSSSPTSVTPRKYSNEYHKCNIQFALTVIYELSRYFTELAVTTVEIYCYMQHKIMEHQPRTCKGLRPSSICYASVLLCLEMISEDSLPRQIRNEFLSKSSKLLNLDPHSEDIRCLKNTIRNAYIPDDLLNSCLSQELASAVVEKLHPIVMLQEAGIMNEHVRSDLVTFLIRKDSRCKRKYPSSPTSTLDENL
mmetsp:Transcript_14248/g.17310  ORF Transcript_14248/g.17310 Transcript_14248/m.17310 type:complete len:382 (+) Transcript_14248:226-1371(+)